jgi:hypothetical protein
MPEVLPGVPNQPGGLQQVTFTQTFAVSNSVGSLVSMGDPVYGVPFKYFNNGGTLAASALGGAATASVGVAAIVGFALDSTATRWFLETATSNQARMVLAFTAPATATSASAVTTVGNARLLNIACPVAPYAQLVVSVTAEAAVTATVAFTGLMHWRK